MNRDAAITVARDAAAERSLPWVEPASARRFYLWPFPPFWRVISRPDHDDPFHAGITAVHIREVDLRVTARRIRPWSDYSMERVILFSLFSALVLAVVVSLFRWLLLYLFGSDVASWFSGIGGGAAALATFSVPLLRIFGRGDWCLRRELRYR